VCPVGPPPPPFQSEATSTRPTGTLLASARTENEPFLTWLLTIEQLPDALLPKVYSVSYGDNENTVDIDMRGARRQGGGGVAGECGRMPPPLRWQACHPATRCNAGVRQGRRAGRVPLDILWPTAVAGRASTSPCPGGVFIPNYPPPPGPFRHGSGGSTG